MKKRIAFFTMRFVIWLKADLFVTYVNQVRSQVHNKWSHKSMIHDFWFLGTKEWNFRTFREMLLVDLLWINLSAVLTEVFSSESQFLTLLWNLSPNNAEFALSLIVFTKFLVKYFESCYFTMWFHRNFVNFLVALRTFTKYFSLCGRGFTSALHQSM